MITHHRKASSSTPKSEINITSNPHLWDWLLIHTDLDKKEHIAIERAKRWHYTNFNQYLKLLNFNVTDIQLTTISIEEFNKINWSFLKSNRYQDAEVFKDQIILLNEPKFVLEWPLAIKQDGTKTTSNLTQIVYDYYRRYIPFLYALVKLIRSQQKCSLELKIPVIDLFFSNFGCVKTNAFNSKLPFRDPKLITIIEDRFNEFCCLRAEDKFGRAISKMTDIIRGLAEYLKIITTVTYFDRDLIDFLHSAFMGDNFERYNIFFEETGDEECNEFFEEAGDEVFVLRDIGWTYTKAFQLSEYAK